MPKFLIEASYTLQGVKGLRSAGGTSRRDAIAHALESVGGTVEHFSFAFGDRDVVLIVDLPDNVAATAVALTVNSAGGATPKMAPLISVQGVDQPAQRSVDYRPPGT